MSHWVCLAYAVYKGSGRRGGFRLINLLQFQFLGSFQFSLLCVWTVRLVQGFCCCCLFVKLSVVVDNSDCTVWFEFIVGSLSLIVNSLGAVKTQTRTYKFCRAPVDSARLSCRSQHESWGTSQPMERPVDAWTCVGADFATRTERF